MRRGVGSALPFPALPEGTCTGRRMDSQTIRTALGELQEDPERNEAWQTLTEGVGKSGGDLGASDALRLFARARRAHESRGEAEAAAKLVALEIGIAHNTRDEAALVVEQARILRDELFDEEGALVANLRILELAPAEPNASAAVSARAEK